jgi:hypothetical protein
MFRGQNRLPSSGLKRQTRPMPETSCYINFITFKVLKVTDLKSTYSYTQSV